jgi:hypothetical protein
MPKSISRKKENKFPRFAKIKSFPTAQPTDKKSFFGDRETDLKNL